MSNDSIGALRVATQDVGCLLKKLPGILGRARKFCDSLQLFYFGQNSFRRARANATIRKNDRFVLDFAPQHFQNGPVVAELAWFWCSLQQGEGSRGGPWTAFRTQIPICSLLPAGASLHANWPISATTGPFWKFCGAKSCTNLSFFRMRAFALALPNGFRPK